MPLARQLVVTRARPHGAGKVSEVSQEEYEANPGAFRWMADEERKAEAADAKAAEDKARRDAAQLLDARQYRAAVCKDRRNALAQQVRGAQSELDKAQQYCDELKARLAQADENLAKAVALIAGEPPALVSAPPPAVEEKAPEPLKRRVSAADSQRVK